MATEVETKAQEVADYSGKVGGLSFVDYVQIVGGMKELPDSDVDSAAIMAQIMGADTLAEGLGENKAEGLRNHIGETFRIHDFRLNKSDDVYSAGSPVYAAIDATFEATGERVVLTTGGANVLAGLGLIMKLGTWDESFTTTTKKTPNGETIKLIYLPRTGGPDSF
jgi:hypothetical protein